MQGPRSEAFFGVLVAKEGRGDHTPKEDAKSRRPMLLHCQPAPHMIMLVQRAAAMNGYAHVRMQQASQCM